MVNFSKKNRIIKMDYKNERDDIISSNQYYMLLKKYKEENEFSHF